MNVDMKKVAIVILNWNGRQMLERYLPSVTAFSSKCADIYVADNASTDDSVEYLQACYPQVRLIRLERNWGFAEGYNKALAQIDAEYYVLLNSDVEVSENWLEPMLEFMDEHQDVCACQPKLLAVKDRLSFEYAGACGGFLDSYGYPFCRGRVFDTVEKDEGQYDDRIEILWATGACLMIRSKDYHSVNGLDARFFAHCEEIDLCWRLRLRGRKIYCLPESIVWHQGGATLPKGNPRKTYLNFRNNLLMLYKNLSQEELGRVMCVRYFLDYVAAFQMLILGHSVADFKAVYKARRDFKRLKKDYKSIREDIQNNRCVDNVVGKFNISILWNYYIKGRRRYSQFGI